MHSIGDSNLRPAHSVTARVTPEGARPASGSPSVDSRTTEAALPVIGAISARVTPVAVESPITGVGAHVTPLLPPLDLSGVTDSEAVDVNVREASTPIEATLVHRTAGKINNFVTGTSAAGSVRTYAMQPDQLDAGTKALQGVVDALFDVQDKLWPLTNPPTDPGIDLAKDNPKFSIDFSRLVLCYTHETTGKYTEVSLLEVMKDPSEKGQALNNAMEALARQGRAVVGSKQIQTSSLVDQCDRNLNKSPALRRANSEFQSRLPQTIAQSKWAVESKGPAAIARVKNAEKRLTAFKGALADRITAKRAEIATVSAPPAAGAPPLAPEGKAARLAALNKDLKGLEAMQEKMSSVDEFALTMALAYSPGAGATPEAIDKAARELKQATEEMYGGLYNQYYQEYQKPHYSFLGGKTTSMGFGGEQPQPGWWGRLKQAAIDTPMILADGLGSWIGFQRVAPETPFDERAQSGAQYAGDVGALLYNQINDSAEQRLHYATYCAEQGIALAQRHATDDILKALIAAETAPENFVAQVSVGASLTPEDAQAIQAQMNPPPPTTP